MNRKILVTSSDCPNLRLRTIEETDQENLRAWKNVNRTSFFYQEKIEPVQQQKWFTGYLERKDDAMFIVEELPASYKGSSEPAMTENCYGIGCLAFRLEADGKIDLYNIIRGKEGTGRVFMKDAMWLLLNYIAECYPGREIKCDVLKDNPAVNWYRKCGFAILQEKEYYVMGIDRKNIPTLQMKVWE